MARMMHQPRPWANALRLRYMDREKCQASLKCQPLPLGDYAIAGIFPRFHYLGRTLVSLRTVLIRSEPAQFQKNPHVLGTGFDVVYEYIRANPNMYKYTSHPIFYI